MELTLHERPHTELNDDDEEDNRETKVANEVIDEEKDIGDGADDDEIYKIKYKHSLTYCSILSSNRERRSF